jgi:hypothetical protein
MIIAGKAVFLCGTLTRRHMVHHARSAAFSDKHAASLAREITLRNEFPPSQGAEIRCHPISEQFTQKRVVQLLSSGGSHKSRIHTLQPPDLVDLPQQELGASLMLHATTLHEPFGLPLHPPAGAGGFMRLNNSSSG